jgi:hypothetical protein
VFAAAYPFYGVDTATLRFVLARPLTAEMSNGFTPFICRCSERPWSSGPCLYRQTRTEGRGPIIRTSKGQRWSVNWQFCALRDMNRQRNRYKYLHTSCQIWGFHGGDYEECRLLGYQNPVRTSQETHYVSATDPSQLMLCKIWGFYSAACEECRLLRRYAVWLL